ncbi:rhodanese-like domain-containing protein [Mucilaginibacter psychrotolerans]|uniref:Rhodanese-like domain-containing protein n=1 Tax=Mucilaginibacter psychrotolerans TaxID=1524096 RepID=A0A4Y8S3S3_9SPHI|nr:rhodanese-like domain-containing protein [Mucilaginibacter psychrotolerans]TFF33609.1 rhodanese-like domain-containing protein [Mucilaginibacter psychrotolerans]
MTQIDAATLQQRLNNNEKLNLLDVREKIEYATYNLGGQNIPVAKLAAQIDTLVYNKTDEIIVICSAGIRSDNAQRILTELGYQNVVNLKGGLIALQKINN